MITVVSGLPRSGTSLIMQMLSAGGYPVLKDDLRAPDEDNPRGYFEWELVRSLPQHPEYIAEAEGKAVKVISSLLRYLPSDRTYKLLFVRRPLADVAASQAAMLSRRKTAGPPLDRNTMVAALELHRKEVTAWVGAQIHIETLRLEHAEILRDAAAEARRITDFLGFTLDLQAMAAQVVPTLHRQRSDTT